MDRKKMLTILLTLTMTFSIFQYATAQPTPPPDPAWNVTDVNNSNVYTLDFIGLGLNTGWSLGIYDYATGTNFITLINDTNNPATFKISNDGNTINVTGGIADGQNLSLSSPNYFGFFFNNGSNNIFNYIYTNVAEDQWALQYVTDTEDAGGPVLASDVNPVPLPASAFLLGAGLIGLIGFRRRVAKR